jgi:hypothetical protein
LTPRFQVARPSGGTPGNDFSDDLYSIVILRRIRRNVKKLLAQRRGFLEPPPEDGFALFAEFTLEVATLEVVKIG